MGKVYLADYRPAAYGIKKLDLVLELDPDCTKVYATMEVTGAPTEHSSLILNGENLQLLQVKINSQLLASDQYHVNAKTLTLPPLPGGGVVEICNQINPRANTALEGLYFFDGLFCTQNEPEGFRKITYFIDRPDNVCRFSTKLIACQKTYPVLLANGNLVAQGHLENGRHFARWDDPFPRPCYLSAIVAGDLGMIADQFVTASGRKVELQIYCDRGNEARCTYAMSSLKKAMKWDEERFGLEYDLDIYMIVAVQSFNMGAMENKGLNIFNAQYVLADVERATDQDFLGIDGVIAHEYFHNWTGNRVSCRDWFQLTLKEGLTVYRDQEFSADNIQDPILNRIWDVEKLRSVQFSEDQGPTAHPIRPQFYQEINNFYTPTVYEKGAEVIRMLATLLGRAGFRRGIEQYFAWFDGQSVTCEDFLRAMSVANGNYNLEAFKMWYERAHTPQVQIEEKYDVNTQLLQLQITQHCPPTEGSSNAPFYFPLQVGILDASGKEVRAQQLIIAQEQQLFAFPGIAPGYAISCNRQFSAPVQIHLPMRQQQRSLLMANDPDYFNRYDVAQELAKGLVRQLYEGYLANSSYQWELPHDYLTAWQSVLASELPAGLKAQMLMMPSIDTLKLEWRRLEVGVLLQAYDHLTLALGQAVVSEVAEIYQNLYLFQAPHSYQVNSQDIGKRSLKNFALFTLTLLPSALAEGFDRWAFQQFTHANNMTDCLGALIALANTTSPLLPQALDKFYRKWQHDPLVLAKWYRVLAGSRVSSLWQQAQECWRRADFPRTNPNLVRAVVGSLAKNYYHFHQNSGAGYEFVATAIGEMDRINPHIAAGLAKCFNDYPRLAMGQQRLMQGPLEKLASISSLSGNVREILELIFQRGN